MKPRRAFTLVELLVVIGIIALLIAILMPALQAARRAAQMTACLSNQRQLLLAVMMYTHENKGYFPGGNRVGAPDNFYAWYNGTAFNPYSVNKDPNVAPTFLAKYVTNAKDISRCPAVAPGTVETIFGLTEIPETNYWYPLSLIRTPEKIEAVSPDFVNQEPQKITSVKQQTKKVVIIDFKTYHQPIAVPINLIAPTGTPEDATGATGGRATRRGVPMGFADGHAEVYHTGEMTRPDVNWTGHYPNRDGLYGVKGKDVW